MKKWLAIIGISLLAVIGLVACGGSDSGGTGGDDAFTVGMVLSGSTTDGGWNQTAYEGLLKCEEDLGATIMYAENVQPADYTKQAREYAKDGCDVVVLHGYEFEDAATTAAEEFPDVKFVVTSSEIENGSNLGSIQNNYNQCGFLQGAFAALMTESGTVAGVGGQEIPPISKDVAGYVAGAAYVKPEVQVKTAFTGDFEDANKVKEQSLTFISQGADIVMVDADHAGRGGYEAAREQGKWAIASIAAEYDTYSDCLIACGEADMATAIEQVCGAVKDGTFEAKCYVKGVEDDIIKLTYNPALESKIPQDVKDKMDQITQDIKDGKLDVSEYIK